MSDTDVFINWKPPGPIARQFMASDAKVQAIMGPVGSGKTQTVFTKIMMLAAGQKRSIIDGKRWFKVCVVRDTYRKLWESTIPSWWELVPQNASYWSGGNGDPAKCEVAMRLGENDEARLLLDFIAVGEQRAEEVMRGYQPTAFYLNEADLLEEDVFTHAISRIGRFPGMRHGGPTWYGVLMDFNAPNVESWVYQRIVQAEDAAFAFFRQPSAESAEAENIANLHPEYYDNLRRLNPQDSWQRRFIRNEFGWSQDGKPIYPEFNDSQHVWPTPLVPVRGIPLILGFDAGLTPACAITQHLPSGQWRVYEEILSEPGTGAARFGERVAQALKDRYADWRTITAWADPSASYGGDKEDSIGGPTWIELCGARSGLMILAAPSNNPTVRWEAVRRPLSRNIDGKPGFILSPTCRVLREGFNNSYRYRKLQVPGAPRYDERAEKNKHSHIHDALQYALSGGGEDAELGERLRFHMEAEHLPREAPPYDPFSML